MCEAWISEVLFFYVWWGKNHLWKDTYLQSLIFLLVSDFQSFRLCEFIMSVMWKIVSSFFFLFFCHGRITIASDSECIRLCLTECHLDKDRVWLRLLTVESMLEQLLTIFPDTYLHIRPPNYLFIQRSFQCWFLVSESEFWCCYTLLWRSLENSELMVEFSEVLLPVHNALLDSLAVCLK